MLLATPCALIAFLADAPMVYLPAMFLAECGVFLNTGPCNAILVNVVPPAMRSTAFAINIFLIHVLGDIWSPIAIGALADATGKSESGNAPDRRCDRWGRGTVSQRYALSGAGSARGPALGA